MALVKMAAKNSKIKPSFPDISIFACKGSKCGKFKDVHKALKNTAKGFDKVELFETECTDRCKYAPIVCLQPANIWFYEANIESVKAIKEEIENLK